MMLAQKHLHELLKEDQEPFHLKDFIAGRRSELERHKFQTSLQARKPKPVADRSVAKRGLCHQACFSTFYDSPDFRKSPFPRFLSTVKSPCKSPSAVLLHVPARTASLLLEAAMRIQKQSPSSKLPKSQQNIKNVGFGLFGSVLKRLKDRTKKREICVAVDRLSAKDSSIALGKVGRKCEKMQENGLGSAEKRANDLGYSWSCNNSRLSSAGWSESNEEKSLDLETCSSCRSEDSEEIEFVAIDRENGAFTPCDENRGFCSSPFTCYLQKSPSLGFCTPDFSSPAASPIRHRKEEEHCEADSLQKAQREEEEEEQSSPVSVLEAPFEEGGDEEEDYGLECSYAIVQRAKLQLLQKLRRFEKLAELDPLELEKIMLEEQNGEEEEEEECQDQDQDLLSQCTEAEADALVEQVLSKSSHSHAGKISTDTKKLLLDLIDEEKGEQNGLHKGSEAVTEIVCKRLNSWKQVQSNTIDMMVGLDIRREIEGWQKNLEQVGETAVEIELAIFGLLVDELSEEL